MSFNESDRLKKIISILKREYPEAKIALSSANPFQLLIATILSAQCTDERVNLVTPGLFKKYKNPDDFAKADRLELERDIFSTGFYRQKAKNIISCCKILKEQYNSKIPDDIEILIQLPGVGRKTASVVLGNGYGIPAIAVDTHVVRLSNLLGLIDSKDAVKIEFRLRELTSKKDWVILSHLFAHHGRKICVARRPKCNECAIIEHCPSAKIV